MPNPRKKPSPLTPVASQPRDAAGQSGDQYRELIDGLDAIVWQADAATLRFTFVSRPAEALLGFPVALWLSAPDYFAELIHPFDRERVLAICRAEIAAGRDFSVEHRTLTADGELRWLRNRVRVRRDAHGARLRGLIVDVTPFMEAARARRQLSAVLEATTDFVGITDALGHVLYINSAGRRHAGHRPRATDVTRRSTSPPSNPQPRASCCARWRCPAPCATASGAAKRSCSAHDGREIPDLAGDRRAQDDSGTRRVLRHHRARHQRAQARRGAMAALLEIAKDIGGSLDLDAILDRVQRRTTAAAAVRSRRHLLLGSGAQHVSRHRPLRRARGARRAGRALEFPPGVADRRRRWQAPRPLSSTTSPAQDWVPLPILKHFGIHALIATPLAVRGRVLGALVADQQHRRPAVQRRAGASSCESIARHVAVAIETTELYRAQQDEARRSPRRWRASGAR